MIFKLFVFQGTCEDAGSVGGHYYDDVNMDADPWGAGYYNGVSGTVSVDFGFTYEDAYGRAFVVHDSTGARITCNVIGDDSTDAPEMKTTAEAGITSHVMTFLKLFNKHF